ncbi:hypothetical protein SELMODRAFT_410329 [Selaginella moellendorffii]|uniref:Large ribosomal subunit protein bL21m n=1 Tax=Selaginella moellendorffii TaxID=88036 RepID=D8REE6_SELML|nr:50S ribosomal protein L21, mitochondrial [Selaginella moellendorffii]XP_002970827.1 50S ribosomal protein L21, mitochondrial [Selaginella moellendorffii]EFJ28153.1 hypothetical protein SELMODRAFT_411445 [Selaginella moellendorffii]EFJ29647.1 hypothetical protein SELMODRAFT_410329 [Selaginella moellendorffii]|eukprot:XP_002969559.1 50S ribosomal protein L21, mitochondrial [Selaginella moellendorffii]
MGTWRRLSIAMIRSSGALFDRPEAPQRFGLGLRKLHSLWRESQSLGMELDLKPGVEPRDVRVMSFGGVDRKRNSDEIMKALGYTVVGRLVVDKPLAIPRQDAFAVFQIGAKQFKVTPGDVLYIERLKCANVNDKLSLHKVMLLGTKTETVVGRPFVPEATISAIVEEHALDAKVIVFKKKRRKNYRRTKGHRQMLTRIRITRINGLDQYVNNTQVEQAPASTENVAAIPA